MEQRTYGGLLWRLWHETVPDLADWTMRSPTLRCRVAGLICLKAAMRKAAIWRATVTEETPLPSGLEEVLAEMADAGDPATFFASIPLFLDLVVRGTAIQAGIEDPALLAPALDSVEETLWQILSLDEEATAKAYRWAGHLEDVLSSVGGIRADLATAQAAKAEPYHWHGGLPALEERHMIWQADPPQGDDSLIGLRGELSLLVVLENWAELSVDDPAQARILRMFDEYTALGMALIEGGLPTVGLDADKYERLLDSPYKKRMAALLE